MVSHRRCPPGCALCRARELRGAPEHMVCAPTRAAGSRERGKCGACAMGNRAGTPWDGRGTTQHTNQRELIGAPSRTITN